MGKVDENNLQRWNPLADDGDALRLAVTLSFTLYLDVLSKETFIAVSTEVAGEVIPIFESWDNDSMAATRRAIVRAAAEIGRAMP